MNSFAIDLLKNVFLVCLFLQSYYAQEETNVTQCLENGLTPDDEPDDGAFDSYATQLQKYTGLGEAEFSVTLACDSTPCIVNPNGTAIWDARMYLYSNNLMSSNDGLNATLDGCLCYSTSVADYESCMEEVRQNMVTQLDTILLERFKEIVEGDCSSLFEENCVV